MNAAVLALTSTELANLAHNVNQDLQQQILTTMLRDMARLSADNPSQWKAFVRDINPTIDNTSILDTFIALLADFEEEFLPNNAGSVEAREDEYERM